MLKEDEILEIKRLYNCKDKTINWIAIHLGYSYSTVKKYVFEYDGQKQPTFPERDRKPERYLAELQGFIEYNHSPKSGKQKLTIKRMYELLEERHGKLVFKLRTLQRYMKDVLGYKEETAFVPQLHLAGTAQLDFGTDYATVCDQLVTIKHLVLNFPHSGVNFAVVLPAENQQCLFWGLNRIFEHIGGIPHTIRIDNASSMVDRGKEYKLNEVFEKYSVYYGFRVERCTPASGNQKGSVERGVRTIRENFLSPIPKFDDFGKFNDTLLKDCEKLIDGKRYGTDQLKSVLWLEDKDNIKPLPPMMFAPVREEARTTNKCGIISIDNRPYTTASNLACKRVTVKLGAFSADIYDKDGKLVVSHQRCYYTNSATDLTTYEDSFVRSPMALHGSGIATEEEAKAISALPKDDRKPAVHALMQQKFGKRIKTYTVKDDHYSKAFEVTI